MEKRPFDAILFDLGSTLIYFDAPWPEILPEAHQALLSGLKSAGFNLDEPGFLEAYTRKIEAYYAQRETEFIEYTTAYILRELLSESGYPGVQEAVLNRALAGMYAITQNHWLPDPKAVPVLEALQAGGYRLGLISNAGDDPDVQFLVDKANLRKFFDVILTSAAVGIRKPNPRIFWKALEALETPRERAAMVGDTLGADILGAQNAGMFAIWVTQYADAPGNRNHRETIHPDATIETIGELPGLLERLER